MTDSADDVLGASHDEPASHGEPVAVVPTGHPTIDQALERLERLDDVDLSLHVEELDAIHGVLRESLANAGRDGVAPESA